MFDWSESRAYGVAPEPLMPTVTHAVYHALGAHVVVVHPGAGTAQLPGRVWGFASTLTVQIVPAPHGSVVQMRVSASFDTETIVVSIALALLFWPALIVCGLLANQALQDRGRQALQAAWYTLDSMMATPPATWEPAPAAAHAPSTAIGSLAAPAGFSGKFG